MRGLGVNAIAVALVGVSASGVQRWSRRPRASLRAYMPPRSFRTGRGAIAVPREYERHCSPASLRASQSFNAMIELSLPRIRGHPGYAASSLRRQSASFGLRYSLRECSLLAL
jgi:hypothetical protein